MNKILVTIYVPFLEEHYDVFIPVNKKINDILKLSIETIYQLSNNNYIVKENTSLINKETGNKYDLNLFVSESDIKNGTSLILI